MSNYEILKCYCGEDSYLDVTRGFDDSEVFLSITKHPTKLPERLKTAWKALRGMEFTASNEIIVKKKDLKRLLQKLLAPKPNKPNVESEESL